MWRKKPTPIKDWPEEHQYLMSIDENGNDNLAGVRRALLKGEPVDFGEQYITVTGVVMERNHFPAFRDSIVKFKKSYWTDGRWNYKGETKSVCLHSREIRRREGPFGTLPGNFASNLSSLISDIPAVIYSSTVDKLAHCKKYRYPFHPYDLALNFIVERFCMILNDKGKTGIILIESRGKREDAFILERLVSLIENGNNIHTAEHFSPIKGVYFNPKWGTTSNGLGSFITLELADLCSYPIYQFVRDSRKNPAFEVVERKLAKYPRYMGCGLKKFP